MQIVAAPAHALVVATLEKAGWEIREVSIDLANDKAVVRLHRVDGRWLYVAADGDRSVVERWRREVRTERGTDVIRDVFLGRVACGGPRQALRTMCNYIAENPAPGHQALGAPAVRNAIRLLMA